MCIAGANACPPEDVGGPPGYIDFVQAMADTTHTEHREMWRWNGGPFDPTAFSLNARLKIKAGLPGAYVDPRSASGVFRDRHAVLRIPLPQAR
jgi:hypothetical protein